jgi:uncharacterized membrane protein YoaK (UPF0700 family)
MLSRPSSLAEFNKKNIAVWISLSFQAGAINAGGFLSCHRFVSHVTGFATHFGAEAALGHFKVAVGTLSVPIYFLLGSMISGWFVDQPLLKKKKPHYALMFACIAFLMLLISSLGFFGFLGRFGETTSIYSDYFMLCALCLSSGIQNATITSASGAVVRTTHLTGITTDLAIGLVRSFSVATPQASRDTELKASFVRFAIIVFFILGSLVSSFFFFNIKFLGFLIPFAISASLALLVLLAENKKSHDA